MARITSKGAKVYFDTGGADTPIAITAITAAAPAVITVDGADIGSFVVGGVVGIDGTGFASVDGKSFFIDAVGATTVTLRGSDTSGEAGTIGEDAEATVHSQQEICFSSLTTSSPPATDIDVTTICDDQKKTLSGLPQPGTVQFEGFYDSVDAGYLAMVELFESGEETLVAIRFSDGSEIDLPVIVDSMSESIGVDQAVTYSATGKITGKRTYVPPAAP